MGENSRVNPTYSVKLVNHSRKSFVWKYFGHLMIGNVLVDEKHFYCSICTGDKQYLTPRFVHNYISYKKCQISFI